MSSETSKPLELRGNFVYHPDQWSQGMKTMMMLWEESGGIISDDQGVHGFEIIESNMSVLGAVFSEAPTNRIRSQQEESHPNHGTVFVPYHYQISLWELCCREAWSLSCEIL